MTAEIITIGDELLIGQVINTNQAFIAGELSKIGIGTERMTTVRDGHEEILEALQESWTRSDLVVTTGGLGPTHDDVTKRALSAFFKTQMVSDPRVREQIASLLKARQMEWTASAEEQTMVPQSATLFLNPVGTAPGLAMEREEKVAIVLPGVPYEMREIMVRSVLPFLSERAPGNRIIHRTLRTTGIPESLLARKVGPLDEHLAGAGLAFLPSPRGVRLRISVQHPNAAEAEERARSIETYLRSRIGKYIYGTEEEELEQVVGRLLGERGLTIATAESCTGGMIADRITHISGSSAYFERGVVAYSNASKTDLLGVPEQMIAAHGAVSKEVARSMATGIRDAAGTDIGLSTTGIAGPTGGTIEKPVGLVWIGCSDSTGNVALSFRFGDARYRVKERASQAALEIVRRRILNIGEGSA
ncbi:MAG: competence/damage-inducible protein A [Bacteroidota bacterium]